MEEARGQRINTLVRNKMRYMFREVLTAIEKESKQFNVHQDFFKKEGKPKGFYAIRKCMFDHGNEIIETLDLIMKELETTPKKAIVMIPKDIMDECGNSK